MVDPVPNTPSAAQSNTGSGVGGSIAVIIIVLCHMRGIDFPAGFEAAIAAVITWAGGFLLPLLPKRQ
jgi:hypothetical protein